MTFGKILVGFLQVRILKNMLQIQKLRLFLPIKLSDVPAESKDNHGIMAIVCARRQAEHQTGLVTGVCLVTTCMQRSEAALREARPPWFLV